MDPVAMLDRLVAFDTTSRNSNLELIDFVAGYLSGHGVDAEILRDRNQPKASLFATVGPGDVGGVILSGHTDVVPVDGQAWSTDPFRLTAAGGRLYARGAADMKGFLAVALALVPDMLAADLKQPIHLALSYDEEVGCSGVHDLIAALDRRRPKPRLCIVGEPTEMKVVTAHKGIRAFETVVTGRDAHASAQDLGASAISAAARLIEFLNRLAAEMKARGEAGSPFSLPFPTINVGTIEGGTAINIIARECRFAWEYRPFPGWDEDEIIGAFDNFAAEEVLPDMRRTAPDATITTTQCARVPVFTAPPDSPAEALAMTLTGRNESDVVAFGTEAGLFAAIGIPTVVCGPGSVRQAHQADEYVAADQIDACIRFVTRLIDLLRSA